MTRSGGTPPGPSAVCRPDAGLVPVVAFDLDQTLLDTRPAIQQVLGAAANALHVPLDIGAVIGNLGPPLQILLEGQLDPAKARRVVLEYRRRYSTEGPRHTRILEGAEEALNAVRRHGGRVLVITGQSSISARAHLTWAGIDVDAVVGGVWGAAKASHLVRHRAWMYVGDHPDDVLAARAAKLISVAVPTGRHSADCLRHADVVLASLASFDAWLTRAIRKGDVGCRS